MCVERRTTGTAVQQPPFLPLGNHPPPFLSLPPSSPPLPPRLSPYLAPSLSHPLFLFPPSPHLPPSDYYPCFQENSLREFKDSVTEY